MDLTVLCFTLLLINICSSEFVNYEAYLKSPYGKSFNSVSEYAKSNGFHNFDSLFDTFKVINYFKLIFIIIINYNLSERIASHITTEQKKREENSIS